MGDAARVSVESSAPKVVVVVPTLDNMFDLPRCLAALSQQTYRPFDVLVVDSRPSAEAAALVEKHGARYLRDDNKTRAAACNHALRELDCDIVIFTDDDCYPPPEWVGSLTESFSSQEIAGVGGPHIAPADQSFWGRVVDVAFASPLLGLGLRYSKSFTKFREVEHNPGCNAAYRKSVLDSVGGFTHAPFGAEDVALDHNITQKGHRLWFQPKATTFHRRRDRFSTLARQMWAYGRGRADTNARCPAVARSVHALPSVVLVGGVLALLLSLVASVAAIASHLGAMSPTEAQLRSIWIVATLPVCGLVTFYAAGFMSALWSPSPYRSLGTVLAAPLVMLLSIVQYGRGFIHWHRVLKPQWEQGQL